MQVLVLELNEVNFDLVRKYASRGNTPHLAKLIDEHGVSETTSESKYSELEPWIQWVTAHTGLSFAEHNVFRLGDIVNREISQIWETLETQGFRVGAISPMNAKNRTLDPCFFVPDPWTETRLSAPRVLTKLYRAIAQAVNDNAQSKLTLASVFWLIVGAGRYARASNYSTYARLVAGSRRCPWHKAMFLDLLLADVFTTEVARTQPQFATLFLNAAAHIQHHYMFNSTEYDGGQQNPEWYIDDTADPVADVYRLYDNVVGQIRRAFPRARLMLATGLHQDPHTKVTYYWRLKDHANFLRKHHVPFLRVSARMSRDFVIECASEADARSTHDILRSVRDQHGTPLFQADNRGSDVFAMLTWPFDIDQNFEYWVGRSSFNDLSDDVAFVAIKNGQHNGTGYFLDTGAKRGELPTRFPLKEIPERVCDALGATWPKMTGHTFHGDVRSA